MKFNDFYVRKTAPHNEIFIIIENDIPIQFRPLNIVEVNYDTLFDPLETAILSKILVSPFAQLQNTNDSVPCLKTLRI